MSVDEKAGTESIPVINELEIRLGQLAPIYQRGKPKAGFAGMEARLLLYPDNDWCKIPDGWSSVLVDEKEFEKYSDPKKYELFFYSELERGILEFHLYEKQKQQ